MLATSLRDLAFSSDSQGSLTPSEFHLHPHYRTQRPLDTLLLKAQAGLDDFVTEKYAEQIASSLSGWTSGLLQSPTDVRAFAKSLSIDFSGASLRPVESRVARSGPLVEAQRRTFTAERALGRDAFVQELRSVMSSFTKLSTADFQIASISAESVESSKTPGPVKTRIMYELVGSTQGFFREQRVGHWDLEWQAMGLGEFRVQAWQTLNEIVSRAADPVFADITAQSLGGNSSYSSQLLHGADHWRTFLDGACGIDIYGHNGISVGDIDDDGFDDLYVCQPAGLPNRLYRNRRDGTFEDITDASGVGILENTACALFADIDNDGRQDLIVVRSSGPLLFLNQGGGKFREKPDAFSFASSPQGTFTGSAIADYDCDGWLDIYFCLYLYYQGTGQYKYPSPYYDAENGPPNFLMRNNRDGTFHDVTAQAGLNQNNTRYSFCCGWSDYNRDGWPDLYVVNDFGRKNLYHNNGNGTFTDIAPNAGVEDVGAGMSVCWSDYDNDGAEDLYVANMWTAAGERISTQEIFQKDATQKVRALYHKHAMGNSLFRNGGESGFRDSTAVAGVGMGRWSWSSDAWDFDHDGFPDLYVMNGMVSSPSRQDLNSFFWRRVVAYSPNEAKPAHEYEQGWSALNELLRSDGTWSGYERNVFYANNRDGTFSDVSGAVGLDFLEDGRAFALADFDHDGRLELFLKNRNGPQLRILKNVARNLAPSITFRLRGVKSNRDAIGAAVTVETDTGHQTRMLQAGSGFLSQHSKELFFGLGAATGPVRASIHWPSGLVQELSNLPANHRIWVEEGSETFRKEPFKSVTTQSVVPQQTPSSSANTIAATEANPFPQSLPTNIETWLLAPISAPDFSLPDLTGQVHRLAAFRGKVLLLNFWVADCETCRQVLELFSRVHKRWSAQGLQLLTINADDPAATHGLRTLVRDLRISFPVVRASDDVAGIYNILYRYLFDRQRDLVLPTSFLIDEKGVIVKVYQGLLEPNHVEQDSRHIPQSTAEKMAKGLPFPGVIDQPEFRRNYLSYGSIFFQREYFDQAGAAFESALRDDPASAEALYGLGSVFLKQEKIAEARQSFERATKLQANYPETLPNTWNNLGLLTTREGRTAEAIPYFKEALRLSPDHLVALLNLGNAYRQQRNWNDARKILERAVQVGPEDPETNYSLGMVFAQIDDTEHAYQYLQQALKFRPNYPEALNNLGVLYLRTQRRDQAIASFAEAIRVAPEFDQSYLNLARVYAIEGAPDKARSVLLDLLKQRPKHTQALEMIEQLSQ
jgi:tetratricopeptide (TPR) repeat protein/peroxiredoxin